MKPGGLLFFWVLWWCDMFKAKHGKWHAFFDPLKPHPYFSAAMKVC